MPDVVASDLSSMRSARMWSLRLVMRDLFRKTKSRFFQMLPLPCVLEVLVPVQQGKQAEFIDPMFSDASSGLKRTDGWMRSSIFMKGLPPLVSSRWHWCPA